MKKWKSSLCLVLVAFIFVSLCNIVSAATTKNEGFLTFNSPTKISIKRNESKLADVKIILTDKQGLKTENIKFYKASVKDGKNVQGTELKNASFLTSEPEVSKNGKKITYTISSKYLNKLEKKFYLKAKDNEGKETNQFFRIIVKENDYTLDVAPRLKSFNIDLKTKKVSFITKDNAGTSVLRLYDVNASNANKVVLEKKNLKDKEAKVEFNLSSFKIDEKGYYKIRIEATDGSKTNKQNISTKIAFSIGKLTMTSVPKNKNLKVGETAKIEPKAKLENNSKSFAIDLSYSSSNDKIVQVDKDGKLTALKARNSKNNCNSKVGKIKSNS